MIHLDTHVALWLYTTVDHERIPAPLLRRLDTEPIAISPIVRLELALLREIGRFADEPARLVTALEQALDLRVDDSSFTAVVDRADGLTFARDPFDRVIAAQALAAGAELATKDRRLRENLDITVWD